MTSNFYIPLENFDDFLPVFLPSDEQIMSRNVGQSD